MTFQRPRFIPRRQMHKNADEHSRLDNPYASPETNPKPIQFAKRVHAHLTFGVVVAFSLPAVMLLLFAWPCLDYGFTAQHQGLVLFFAYGGHAILMIAFWGIAVAFTRTRSPDSLTSATSVGLGLAVVYLPTAAICWLMVVFGVVSWI